MIFKESEDRGVRFSAKKAFQFTSAHEGDNASFDLDVTNNKIESTVQVPHKVDEECSTVLNANGGLRGDSYFFTLESTLNFEMKNFVLSAGIGYSRDGPSFLLGAKIAGIKFRIPIVFVTEKTNGDNEDAGLRSVMHYLVVAGIHVAGTLLIRKLRKWLRNRRRQVT